MELFPNDLTAVLLTIQAILLPVTPISMLMCCRHEQTCIHIDCVEGKTYTEGPTTPDLCITEKKN